MPFPRLFIWLQR